MGHFTSSSSPRPQRLVRSGVTAALAVLLAAFAESPTANLDAVTVAEDSGDTVIDVLVNDIESDTGGPLTVTAVTEPVPSGTVTLMNGQVSFAPALDFNGDATFTYTVSDGNGGTATAIVEVTVTAVNDPPTGEPDVFPLALGSGPTTLDVLANDTSDPDSDETLTVSQVTRPVSGGMVSIAPGGTGVVFTPAPGFWGPVEFTYTLTDGNGGSSRVSVTVNVGQVDSDDDGLDDATEATSSLDPRDADTDDDGVPDGLDGLMDSDQDGTIDALDTDSDNDGLRDGTESGVTAETAGQGTDLFSGHFVPDADPATTTDPRNADTDGDGLSDGDEDASANGAVDSEETDPNDADTDDGGFNDGEEVDTGSNPLDPSDDQVVRGRGCASTGTGTLLPLVLLLAVPLLRRRQVLLGAGKAWGLPVLLAAALMAAPASAHDPGETSQAIDVQQYKPGPGGKDVLGLHSARVARHLGWNLGMSFNYAKDPLNFLRPRTGDFFFAIVKHQATFDLMGSIGLFDRFELGVALPITSQGSSSAEAGHSQFPEGLKGRGVGDLRLVLKEKLFSTEGGLHMGLAVPLLLPTSGGKEFLGRSGVAAFPRVLGEWVSESGARVLANVGVNLQPRQRFYNLNVGDEFAYGVGAQVPFRFSTHRWAAEATLMGAIGITEKDLEERPLEVLASVRYHLSDTMAAHLGVGSGLTGGYGSPGFRVLTGFVWTAAERDQPERIEPERIEPERIEPERIEPESIEPPPPPIMREPRYPEEVDDFPDEPPPQQQNRDAVPDEPSPPRRMDSDGDGLADDKDLCPQFREDKDGFEDEDGCPDSDNDQDGVIDAVDRCPTEQETRNGVKDHDGCPDT